MFADRRDAGRRLAARLAAYEGRPRTIVLGIPRGGVVVGAEVARALRLPLDVILTKKIGHPRHPEFAIGVVDLRRELVDWDAVRADSIETSYLESEIARIRESLRERYANYRGGRPSEPLTGHVVLIVDDGIATGSTMLAAVRLARDDGAARVVAAAPVAPRDRLEALEAEADEVVVDSVPDDFFAIGQFYDAFDQVSDGEAMALLRRGVSPPSGTRAR